MKISWNLSRYVLWMYLLQVSGALEYLAENGFVHGGVAAENCLGECTVCICTEECIHTCHERPTLAHIQLTHLCIINGSFPGSGLSEQSSVKEQVCTSFSEHSLHACGIPTLKFQLLVLLWYMLWQHICICAEEYYSLLGLKGAVVKRLT